MRDISLPSAADKDTDRLEAFSDGVFSVAITLLVLDLVKVPTVPTGSEPAAWRLALALVDAWPSYVTFVVSFITILIMWMNHHNIFSDIARNDTPLMLA